MPLSATSKLCRRSRNMLGFGRANSQGDDEALNRWVQQIVSQDGWPTRDDSVFVARRIFQRKQCRSKQLYRWSGSADALRSSPAIMERAVASVAAGTNLGVAPEATIIPIVTWTFSARPQRDERLSPTLPCDPRSLCCPVRTVARLDDLLAGGYREDYAKFDIINRSYGIPTFSIPTWFPRASTRNFVGIGAICPRTLDAVFQVGTPDSRKTIHRLCSRQ